METSLCATCILFFQKALNSPVGSVVSSLLKIINPPIPSNYNILSIYEKLRQNKSYQTPEEWIEDLKNNINQSIQFFGIDSEISIALESIQQNIIESTRHLLKRNRIQWKESKEIFIEKLDNYSQQLPNNIDMYKEFTSTEHILNNQAIKEPFVQSLLTQQTEKIDLNELKLLIQGLPTDEDHQYIRKIISHYEPEYSNVNGIIQIELNRFHPYTLRLIKEYVVKHSPPLQNKLISIAPNSVSQNVNPHSIQRMKSTPITSSHDVKKQNKPLNHNSPSSVVPNMIQNSTKEVLAKTLQQVVSNGNYPTAISTITAVIESLAKANSGQLLLKKPNTNSSISPLSHFLAINSPTKKLNEDSNEKIKNSSIESQNKTKE